MTKRVLAVIPARKGSKGLASKNKRTLLGKPLIQWTIEAAKSSKSITSILVTSDDDDIINIAEACGVLAIERPSELAEDNTPMVPVITHAIKSLAADSENFDQVVLLQPTSPLRSAIDIDNAFSFLEKSNCAALISGQWKSNSCLKYFIEENGVLYGAVNDRYPFSSRQLLPRVFGANGAIYIAEISRFLKLQTLLIPDDTTFFEMSYESSIDVDGLDDFLMVEKVIQEGFRN